MGPFKWGCLGVMGGPWGVGWASYFDKCVIPAMPLSNTGCIQTAANVPMALT